ncbi:scavenger receptor cysteine-rich domain-containing protein DMBT1-like [Amphiura filiformis]|uniref:scavenger receptor cysteine-rich domain-containing protein DMBT1-like n=1 Tax=Amphiura filiformis TaxID=82378 RepID=UPI003B223708
MADVNCSGSEVSLLKCLHNKWGEHRCGHHEDAGVICTDDISDTTIFSEPIVLNLADVEVELCLYESKPHDGHLYYAHSCRNRCGYNLSGFYNCKCDILCEAHGDCCIDYGIYCRLQPGVNQTRTTFRNISNTINSDAYQDLVMSWGSLALYERCIAPTERSDFNLLINRCPDDSSLHLKEACAKSSPDDPISFIPVSVNNVHYKNRFCAICWGYNDTSGQVWDLEVECKRSAA